MEKVLCAREAHVGSGLVLKLIEEDMKLNHLHFGLSDLGIDLEVDILGIAEIVFELMQSDQAVRENYYQKVNELRSLTYQELSNQLAYQSQVIFNEILTR